MKNIIRFLICLIPWFLSGILFSKCTSFFDKLVLPFFALPKNLYGIVWTIIYFFIAISICIIYNKNNYKYLKNYNEALISNYIFNQLYLFFMFRLQNTFLGFADALAILITSLMLYYETKEIDEKSSKFLLIYVYFSLYATILSLGIYFLNV